MHNGLRQRIQRLEKRSGAEYVRVPIPGRSGQSMRLPVAFATFMADQATDGQYHNMTNEQFEDQQN